ncbi:DUF4190 domain-containing protein [Saccharopolyspora sp. NPDC002376]
MVDGEPELTTPPYDPNNPNSGGFEQPYDPNYAQQPYVQPQYGQPAYVPVVGVSVLPPNNGLAVASMVVSLVGIPLMCAWIGFLLGILGVVFGHIAQTQIKRDGTRGSGMAMAGIVIGYCIIGFLAALVALPFLITGFAVPLLGM